MMSCSTAANLLLMIKVSLTYQSGSSYLKKEINYFLHFCSVVWPVLNGQHLYEERPCPHVPLLLNLHFLLILRLSLTQDYDLGISSCTFFFFPFCTLNYHLLVFPICCPKMFELLPSILIPPHVPDMSDLPLMLQKSLWYLMLWRCWSTVGLKCQTIIKTH